MGSPSRSTIVRSSRVSWPTILSSISLPERSARSRTTRGNREKSSSTGTIRSSSVVSRISRLTRSSDSRACSQGASPEILAQALEVVGKDHELAGQADQVVELQGVDADPGVRPGTREWRKPAHLGARAGWTGRCRGPAGNRPRPLEVDGSAAANPPASAGAAIDPAPDSGLGARKSAAAGVMVMPGC